MLVADCLLWPFLVLTLSWAFWKSSDLKTACTEVRIGMYIIDDSQPAMLLYTLIQTIGCSSKDSDSAAGILMHYLGEFA